MESNVSELLPSQALNEEDLLTLSRTQILKGDVVRVDSRHLNVITTAFSDHFTEQGYIHNESVPITAKLDPSVRFIGAPISVMKPMFLTGTIPESGIFMVQNCVRTRNVPKLMDTTSVPKYGSFFTGMCTLTNYDQLEDLANHATTYLTKKLKINHDDICININTQDTDLLEATERLGISNINLDTQAESYYRHKYGLTGVWGRNFNFGIRSLLDGNFEDIGNLIVIENEDGPLGVELALGDTTILKQIYGLDHIQDSYGLSITEKSVPEAIRRKFEDAIITSLALTSEGLRPGANNNQTRLLRTYLKSISMYSRILGIDYDELRKRIISVESGFLPFMSEGGSEVIVDWIANYNQEIVGSGPSNKEDLVILKTLGDLALLNSLESKND